MKRKVALLLAMIMAFTTLPITVFAEGTGMQLITSIELDPEADSVEAGSDTLICYTVALPKGYGVTTLTFNVEYSSDLLEIVEDQSEAATGSVNLNYGSGVVRYSMARDTAASRDIDLLYLTFVAKEEALASATAQISIDIEQCVSVSKVNGESVATPVEYVIPETQTVAITVTNPAKFEVTSKNILVGGDHKDGNISFEAVKLPDLTASDISATEDSGVLEFGTPTIQESGCGFIPFMVKSGAAAGEVTVTVKAGSFSDTCTVFVDKPAVEGDRNVGSTLTAKSELAGATFKWIVILGDGADMQSFERGTGASYTLVEADKGGVVKLEVSHPDYEGMDYVYANPILGAKPAAPTVELASNTLNSITLKAIEGAEYSINGGETWQDSSTFNDLEVGKEYTVSVRIKEVVNDTPAGAVTTATFSTKGYEAQEVKVTLSFFDKDLNSSVKADWYNYITITGAENNKLFITGTGEKAFTVAVKDNANYYINSGDFLSDIQTNINSTVSGSGMNLQLLDPTKPGEISIILYEKQEVVISAADSEDNDITGTEVKVSYKEEGFKVGTDAKLAVEPNGLGVVIEHVWKDAEGNAIEGDPVNVGTYKLYASAKGGSTWKAAAEKEMFTLVIEKVDRTDVPKTPTLVSKTENSLTVKNDETGVEWMLYDARKNPITGWMQGENGQVTFTGLTDGTRYVVVARYAESANQSASGVCAVPLQEDTVYAPKTIKIFGYVNDPSEYLSGLFKVYLADENDNPTNVELTTITAGESNAKRVVIMLTEEARENYYLNSYPGGVPSRFETGMSGTGSKSLNAYSFATTLTGHDNGLYLPEDDELKPRFDIRLIEKKENTFLVSKNGAVAVPAPAEEIVSYNGSAFTAQGALQASEDAVFTVIPAITDTGMQVPAVCWKDANGEAVANPVNAGTYYLYASLAAGTMWKVTPETPVLTLTVEKGEQAAPASAPEKVSATTDSVTVKLADAKKVQFAIDDGSGSLTWYDAASDGTYTFTGLEAYTKYNVVARYAANDNQLASPASAALEVQTEPAPQNIGVKVKCGDKELNVADFKVYEGSSFFDWKITGAEEATITVKLSDDAKATYKPNACSVVADGIAAVKGTCANGEYSATVSLTDYTKGGTVTFNLTEKETLEIRVCEGQKNFNDMEKSLTDTREYDGKAVGYGELHGSEMWDPDFFAQSGMVYTIRNNTTDVHPTYIDSYWVDAQGTELSDDPVNIGTYKLIAKFDGNEKYKPLAETLLVTLTINPAVMETPAAPTVGEATKDSVSYTGVKGQKYIVTTSATAPAADAEGWKECTADGTMTENGLEPNTQYYIHTFVPALSANHADSAVATTAVTTAHSYGVEVAEEITLTWNVRVGTDLTEIADMRKGVPIKSTGTGQIYVKRLNTKLDLFCAETTIVTLSTSAAKSQLKFWPLPTNSTAAAGKVEETFTYEVRKNDSTDELIKTFTVKCVLNVLEKNVVTFTDFADTTVTYGETYNMETAKPQVQTGVAAYDGELEYYYTDKDGVTSTQAPVAAGTYTVTVKVPDSNADYAGQDTATLTISKKEVELTGLAVKEKTYDGTTGAELDETGASLEGVLPGDNLSCNVTSATFNSANVDEANAVTVAAQLEGVDKDNYTLKEIAPITATIKPREVSIVVTAKDKAYDGTIDAEVTAAYAANSGMLDADAAFITLKAENGAFSDKNVGQNKQVTFTVVFENNGSTAMASNYTPMYAASTTASISAKPVTVTFNGEMNVDYDGQPKSVTAKLDGVLSGDDASVAVVYGADTAAPILAGEYVLTAKDLTNSNYKLAAEPYTQSEAARTLKIGLGEYTPGSSSAEKSIGYLDTDEKSYDLKELFGIEIDGTFEVFFLEENEILAKHELISGNAIVQLKEGCTIGEKANITYVFTPAAANTYKSFTVALNVKVAAETVKSIEIIGAPDKIEIGTELDLSAITLKVTFENGKTATFTKDQYAASGYSTALKEENLGTQALTLTVNANGAEYSASKNINVTDVLTGLSMEADPTKTEYALGAAEIDLAGGKVKASYKSGAEKVMDLTDPALTLGEVTEAMMRTLGDHDVAVSYTEGSTFQTTFTFTVVTGSVENPGEGETGGTVADDDEFLADPDDENSKVPGSDVNVSIGAAQDPEGAEDAVEAKYPALKDKNIPLGAKLEGPDGEKVHAKQPVPVQIAYPAGTDSKDSFMIYLVNEDGSLSSITPTKEDKHISFELPAGFSEGDFVLAWQKYVKPGTDDEYDDTTGSFKERQRKFWKGVVNSIENSKPGKVITIGAGDYDQMPVYVMEAVMKHNVGLRIRWNGGKEILLAPSNALKPEENRLYYPLSYLEKYLAKVELGAGGSIILAPQTGDEHAVTDYNMGFFVMPGAIAESADHAEAEISSEAPNGSANAAPVLMLTASLAALAAGWFVSNRRRKEEN